MPFARSPVSALGEVVLYRTLRLDPLDVACDSLFNRRLRLVADAADAADVRNERTNLAGAKLAARQRFDVTPS